jgi:hypothetical protein
MKISFEETEANSVARLTMQLPPKNLALERLGVQRFTGGKRDSSLADENSVLI